MSWALLIYADEGTYYYTPLNASSLKDALAKALEIIYDRDDPWSTDWEIAEVAAVYPYQGEDFKAFFDRKSEAARAENLQQIEKRERDDYERLKSKFEGTKKP